MAHLFGILVDLILIGYIVHGANCMRRIWSIPHNSHCFILKYLYGSCDSDILLLSIFLKCIHGALRSDNCIVSVCAKLMEQSQ